MRKQRPDYGTPHWLALPIVIAFAFLLIPFLAMILRVKWSQLPDLLRTTASQDALVLSLVTCAISTLLCVIFGVPLAIWLAKSEDTWISRTLRTLVTLPMVLPPVVAGLALLITWGRMGVVGAKLSILGFDIGFTTLAVIFAQTFVALPFMTTSLEGALRTRGFTHEIAAQGLGASKTRTLFSITLPLAAPAIASSTALAFSRCLGEFGATLTFAGSLQGVTRTLPLEIYLQRETDSDLALALSVVLVAIAFVVVAGTSFLAKVWTSSMFATAENTTSRDATTNDTATGNTPTNDPTTAMTSVHDSANTVAPQLPHPQGSYDEPGTPTSLPQTGLAPSSTGPTITIDAAVEERHLDIQLSCTPAAITAFIGANGAGKSSLVSLIAGTLHPDRGGVKFSTPHPRIVLLAQNPALFPHMSVESNVVFGLRCHGVPLETARRLARERLRELNIGHLVHRKPQQLSGGQARRVALARALAIEPDVVLFDEPFAGLDIHTANQLRTILPDHLKGTTSIIVTHDLADVKALDCHLVIIDQGRIAKEGYWKDLINAGDDELLDELARKFLLDSLLSRQ